MASRSRANRQLSILLVAAAAAIVGLVLTAHSGRDTVQPVSSADQAAEQDSAPQPGPVAAAPGLSEEAPHLGGTSGRPRTPVFERPVGGPTLEILDHHPAQQNGSLYVKGHVRNNANLAARYVRIGVAILDRDGKEIGTAYATTADLAAHAIWDFKVIVTEVGAHSYRVLGVSTTP